MAVKERSEQDPRYLWKPEHIYPTDEAWQEALERLRAYPPLVRCFEGKLGESGETLLAYLRLDDEISAQVTDVMEYAMLRGDSDTRVAKYQAMNAQARNVLLELSTAGAFETGELLAIPEETLAGWYETVEGLALYRRHLEVIRSRREHTLSPAEEKLLAAAGDLSGGPDNIFSMFNDADLTFPDVEDGVGNRLPLSLGTYGKYIESKDRTLRKNTYDALYTTYSRFRNTLAAVMAAQTKQLWFFAKARKYPSSLAAAVAGTEVPEDIYHNLLSTVEEHLPSLHRYVALRKKLLGVETLHPYDMYAPIVGDVTMEVPFEEAKELVLEALKPLGEEYLSVVRQGLEGGWIDVYENAGKRSGGYCAGPNVHPYILLNYQDKLADVFTLIHEMGHAMHTWLSNQNQPQTYKRYQIFVAEVASTCNECLLMQYLLGRTTDRRERAYLINYYLEQFRSTFFRQTQLAAFELEVNELAQSGQGVTAEACCKIYRDLQDKYFGPALESDDNIALEWSRIPHFYYNFYLYQYATGFAAAVALSQKILHGGKEAVEAYLGFLKGGCSKSPIELLKGAGVDMSTPEPLESAIAVFDGLPDEMEALCQ
ncbi:MAG: oligoendopeptidase F [Clostridiales bacterium]|nr:oligoendopeptidase F [Clostridiales bacterium]